MTPVAHIFRPRPGSLTAFLLLAALLAVHPPHGTPAGTTTLLITSNLEGRFTPEIDGQETRDPMLLLAQSIAREAEGRKLLYFDLGNSFYPGVISKYNYGASMIDLFTFLDCRGTLLSSMDLRIGVGSLNFLQSRGKTRLMSANILQEGESKFTPYLIQEIGGKKTAVVALSSKKVLVDVAEKNVYRIGIADEKTVMERIVAGLKDTGVRDIILLSGLDFRESMALMAIFPEIRLTVTGGDNRGSLIGGTVTRIDLADRRSIVSIPPDSGYCLLTLAAGDGIRLADVEFRQPARHPTASDRYRDFVERVSGWKRQFASSLDGALATAERPLLLDQYRTASLLRDRFNAELSICRPDAVTPRVLSGRVSMMDVLSAVNDDYPVYTFRLTGADIAALSDILSSYIVTGYDGGTIQGYPIDPRRSYLAVSTQSVFEEIEKALRRRLAARNRWSSITEIIVEDLKGKKVVFRDDYRYLERKFRYTVDIFLSAFYDSSKVIVDKSVKLPVGEPGQSYNKWGIEGKLDLTAYNRLHKITFTPYVNYSRQDRLYLKNLLRGTLFYTLNLHPHFNPYQKLQFETVILPVRGADMPRSLSTPERIQQYIDYKNLSRPVEMRETVGMNVVYKSINGTLGIGFEKSIHDPVRPIVFGLEAQVNVRYAFRKAVVYNLKFDSFLSLIRARGGNAQEKHYFRSELENSFSFRLAEFLRLTLKHRWYFHQSLANNRRYSNSQIIASCDMRTNFKF